MIYKTEFEIAEDVIGLERNLEGRLRFEKERAAANLGLLIGERIGFEEVPNNGMRLRLEVQAFSRKEWEMFKQELKSYIEAAEKTGLATFNLIVVGKMIQQLESIGYTQQENKINQ
jgi:hypothetical protein